MQNQRTGIRLYRNSIDCLRKVMKNEGIRSMYRGLMPQAVGAAPKQAIKLTVYDGMRSKYMDEDGDVPLEVEIFSGFWAGVAQAMIANPFEIIKVRLQISGAQGVEETVSHIVEHLKLPGLYRGVLASVMRDGPFAAMYFPTYQYCKERLADDDGNNPYWTLFVSAVVAAVPATRLMNPLDVVKTRLQAPTQPGTPRYEGILDCAARVYKEEGFMAFWRGTIPRMIRVSTNLGITLLVYEWLQDYFAENE